MFGQTKYSRGSAAVEFILVLPSFLVLTMFVMEVSLMWIDRHYLRLAAFESARVLANGEGEPCADPKDIAFAKRKAWMRMAHVAPSIKEYVDYLGDGAFEKFPVSTGVESDSSIKNAFFYLIKRLPVAALMTDLTCSYSADDPQAVTVTLIYNRSPRLPFIRETMWGLYVLNKINAWLEANSLQSFLALDLDQFYFGVVADSPKLNEARGKLQAAQDRVTNAFNIIRRMKLGLEEGAALLEAAGMPLSELGIDEDLLDDAAVDRAEDMANASINAADQALVQLNKELKLAAQHLTTMLYMVPWQFRYIPMKVSVRLVRTSYKNAGKGWDNGKAMFVAPFNDQEPHWREWAEKMSTITSDL